MKPARIILILVAVIAAGLAAFLVLGMNRTETNTVVTEVVREEAKSKVLVASRAIGIGERLTAASLQWQDWPEGAVRSEYVTSAAVPNAPEELTGAVVRFEFFPGEPIREAKLVRADQGYLSAVLAPGMRGVSVGVDAVSSAGGFIVPNDHVDVVLTTQGDQGQQSQVLMTNVRVLAIGKRLGELGTTGAATDTDGSTPQSQTFDNSTIATLELFPGQAESLINGSTRGQLSLTLRSVVDFKPNSLADAGGSNQSVRLIRFGREQSVLSNGSAQPEPQGATSAVGPAAAAPVTLPSPALVEPQLLPR